MSAPTDRDQERSSMPSEFNTAEQATYHTLLGNERRLEILDILANVGWIKKRPLAAEIASRETGEDVEAGTEDYRNVYVALHQTHLPKLADHDVIVRDHDVIAQGPAFDDALNARNAVAVSRGIPVGTTQQDGNTMEPLPEEMHSVDIELGGEADGE